MAEYIDREAAMSDVYCVGISCQECPFLIDPIKGGCKVDEFILSLPAADVAEVRRGKWLEWDDGEGDTFECSVCGELWTLNAGTPIENNMNYCPRCGAKMDKSEFAKDTNVPDRNESEEGENNV